MKDFKYTAKFEIQAKADFQFLNFKQGAFAAESPLNNLRGLLPAQEIIDANDDLRYIACNLAVVNMVNANDDGITANVAAAITPYFVDRPVNLQHNRDVVIGHVISSGFSKFSNSELIAELDGETKESFNIAMGAVLYRVCNDYVTDELVINEPDYLSASWEIGFNDYVLLLGSKQVSAAEIVTDKNRIDELSQYLRANGGTGITPEGLPVYRLIVDAENTRPLGVGLTPNPASPVKGLMTAEQKEVLKKAAAEAVRVEFQKDVKEEIEKIEVGNELLEIQRILSLSEQELKDFSEILVKNAETNEISFSEACKAAESFARQGLNLNRVLSQTTNSMIFCKISGLSFLDQATKYLQETKEAFASVDNNNTENQKSQEKNKNNSKTENNSSQLDKTNVTKHKQITHMKITDLKQITASFLADNEKETIVASLKDFFNEEMDKANEKLKNTVLEKEAQETAAKELATNFASLQESFQKIEAEHKETVAKQVLTDRVALICEEYVVSAEGKEKISATIKGLNDADFATWKDSFSVFAQKKSDVDAKKVEALKQEAEAKRLEAEASEIEFNKLNPDLSRANANPPNGTAGESDTLAKMRGAFDTGIEIQASKPNVITF